MAEPLRRVGRYEILGVIGRGGTAIVYLAHQPDLNRQVGLKELSAHHAGDPRFAERFIEESRLIGAMNHPNIVTVHEFFEHDGLPYIAMEYLPRGSLRPYLTNLSLPQIFGVAENVLSALAHGESHETVHRDLKPENLLVTGDGQVKVTDYGVARALNTIEPRAYATMTGTAIGTPAYMAPEQALGETLGPESDLYSLGIILWEALAGRQPFSSSDTPMAVLYQKTHEPVPPISSVAADVDPDLSRWLEVVLARNPADRFSSARVASDQLEDVAIGLLGPRWRRESRIDVEMAGSASVTPDLSAAPGDQPGPREGAASRRPTDETRSLQRETPTAWGSRHTPTPTRSPNPETPVTWGSSAPRAPGPRPQDELGAGGPNMTLMRNSRRHGADEEAAVEAAEAPRQWRLWLAAGLTALLAAGAGVGIGVATTPSAPPAGTRTETTPPVVLAAAVKPVLATLGTADARGVKVFGAEHNSAGQASAAAQLERDYEAAYRSLHRLPASERRLSEAQKLTSRVADLVRDWRAVSAAAKAAKTAGYDRARLAVERDAERLAAAAAVADRG